MQSEMIYWTELFRKVLLLFCPTIKVHEMLYIRNIFNMVSVQHTSAVHNLSCKHKLLAFSLFVPKHVEATGIYSRAVLLGCM